MSVGDGHVGPGSLRSDVALHCNVCSMTVRNDPTGSAPAAWPDDLDELERALLTAIAALAAAAGDGAADAPLAPGSSLTAAGCSTTLFDAQLDSRHLDHAARWLRARGAASTRSARPATRPTPSSPPPCARPIRRCCTTARAASTSPGPSRSPGHDGVGDVLLGLLASADEPIAGGRHKVFGHAGAGGDPADVDDRLAPAAGDGRGVRHRPGPPPRRCRRAGRPTPSPCASFGDASLNHSTAQGALNAAAYTAHQGMPMPLLLVCEDNGLGHQRADARRAGSRRRWPAGPGCATSGPTAPTRSACSTPPRSSPSTCARRRRPAVLHLRTVRFGGHAGTDVEAAYRTRRRRSAPTSARDPLLATARRARRARRGDAGRRSSPATSPAGPRCAPGPIELAERPPLRTRRRGRRAAGAAPAGGRRRPRRRRAARRRARAAFFGRLPEDEGPLTLAESINRTLGDLLVRRRPGARVRRGRRRQGRRLRRHPRAAAQGRPAAGVRHAARRAVDPRARPRRRRVRARADPRDPVPRLPAQRRGPAARRGGQPVVLLQRPVHQPARRAHRRLRLPAGLRRPLPQRQRASPCCATSPAS